MRRGATKKRQKIAKKGGCRKQQGGDVAHAIYSNFRICKSVIAWQNSYLDPVSEGDDEYNDFDDDKDDDDDDDEDQVDDDHGC